MPVDNDTPPQDDDLVRPYLITGGRTRADVDGLQFETLVEANGAAPDGLRFEAAQVFALCRTATGIAEISAQLGMPIATVKVVVGDLVNSGHVRIHDDAGTAPQGDAQLINRIIEGVRRL